VVTVTTPVTVGCSFGDGEVYMRLNPEREGQLNRPEHARWSSYNNFAWFKSMVEAGRISIGDVPLALRCRATEKPTVRTALNVATRPGFVCA
jgi:hypothetical protein